MLKPHVSTNSLGLYKVYYSRAVIPFKLGPNIGPIPNGKKRPFSQFSVEKFPIMLTLLSQDEKKNR